MAVRAQVTEDVVFGIARPAALEAAGAAGTRSAEFIDCQWPRGTFRPLSPASRV